MTTYTTTVANNNITVTAAPVSYALSLSRTGGQGSKGDSVQSMAVASDGTITATIVTAAGATTTSNIGSIFGSAGGFNLASLSDTNISSVSTGEVLKWDGSDFVNNTLVEADIQSASTTVATIQAQNLDMGTNKILYSNMYANAAALPSAASYHGMFAHTHDVGKGVFAHGGSWHTILDETSSTTSNLTEGSNLYYTDARAKAAITVTDAGGDGSLSIASGVITYTGPSAAETQAHITGGTGVTVTSGAVAIGQDVATTATPTFGNITTTGELRGPSTFTIDPATVGDNTGTVVIAGNLTVNGSTTTVNSNEVNIGDAIILLNSDETGTPSANAGISIERGTASNKSFVWNETSDAWDLSNETLQNVIIDGGSY